MSAPTRDGVRDGTCQGGPLTPAHTLGLSGRHQAWQTCAREVSLVFFPDSEPAGCVVMGGVEQKTKADLGVDLEKFSKLIGSLQSHKTTLQRKVSERQVELDSKQAELRSVTAVNDALRERVATQVRVGAVAVQQQSVFNRHRASLDATRRRTVDERHTLMPVFWVILPCWERPNR